MKFCGKHKSDCKSDDLKLIIKGHTHYEGQIIEYWLWQCQKCGRVIKT